MRIELRNATNYQTRALRRALTQGKGRFIQTCGEDYLAGTKRVRIAVRPGAKLRYPRLDLAPVHRSVKSTVWADAVFTLPQTTATVAMVEALLVWYFVARFTTLSRRSQARLYRQTLREGSDTRFPLKPKRKRVEQTKLVQYETLRKRIADTQNRMREHRRQLKRNQTLLTKQKKELRQLERVLFSQAHAPDLTDPELKARLRYQREH